MIDLHNVKQRKWDFKLKFDENITIGWRMGWDLLRGNVRVRQLKYYVGLAPALQVTVIPCIQNYFIFCSGENVPFLFPFLFFFF